jgi:hypothetical protein
MAQHQHDQHELCEFTGENDRRQMTPHCYYSEESARKAVKETFAILGVDVNDPSQVEEFRKSLRFSDELRTLADKGKIAIVVALVGTLAAALWIGLKTKLSY